MSSKRPKAEVPTAMRLLIPARETREVTQAQGHGFAPMVLVAPRVGEPQLAILDGDGRLHDLLSTTLAEMRRRLGPLQWCALTTDAYVRPTPEPDTVEHGQLARAFADGDPEVTEQMVVILKRRGEPVEIASQVYRWIPSEGFEWDEPEAIDEYAGPVTDVLTFYM